MIEINDILKLGKVWTSEVDDVLIRGLGSKAVTVSLSVAEEETPFFKTVYYPYNGTVCVRNVRELVEQAFRSRNLVVAECALKYGADGYLYRWTAVYCSAVVHESVKDVAGRRFLTTLDSVDVPSSGKVLLPLLSDHDQEVAVSGACEDKDGNVRTFRYSFAAGTADDGESYACRSLDVSPAAVMASEAVKGLKANRLLSYTVVAGSRTFSVFVRPSLALSPKDLHFRNIFNAEECCTLEGVTARKTEVSRASAVISGVISYYDQEEEQTFEAQTPALQPDAAVWLEQLLMSRDVWDSDGEKVLIADSSMESNDDISSCKNVKITWRYADTRPHVRIPYVSSGVFTDEFDYQFA